MTKWRKCRDNWSKDLVRVKKDNFLKYRFKKITSSYRIGRVRKVLPIIPASLMENGPEYKYKADKSASLPWDEKSYAPQEPEGDLHYVQSEDEDDVVPTPFLIKLDFSDQPSEETNSQFPGRGDDDEPYSDGRISGEDLRRSSGAPGIGAPGMAPAVKPGVFSPAVAPGVFSPEISI